MLRVGIIGAGSISQSHIKAYKLNKDVKVCAISDINYERAKLLADEYDIGYACEDYRKILNDKSIDAVSIVTPTFTHKNIVIESLRSGKHVLCEKPPAINADEARECIDASRHSGKVLMYGFVCRFRKQTEYLKEYIDSGKMGRIVSAEAVRIRRCDCISGWFLNKAKAGGGPLMDAAIHELDSALYLMGYPKPKVVLGFTSDVNKDLPDKIQGKKSGWISADKSIYDRDVENVASGYIVFENGSSLFVKASTVLNTVKEETYIDICGEKSGARIGGGVPGKELQMLELTEDCYFKESYPFIDSADIFQAEINHFYDCCINKAICLCKHDEVISLMEILDAIYTSAETGEAIRF